MILSVQYSLYSSYWSVNVVRFRPGQCGFRGDDSVVFKVYISMMASIKIKNLFQTVHHKSPNPTELIFVLFGKYFYVLFT